MWFLKMPKYRLLDNRQNPSGTSRNFPINDGISCLYKIFSQAPKVLAMEADKLSGLFIETIPIHEDGGINEHKGV
jgi:hypothetical protein